MTLTRFWQFTILFSLLVLAPFVWATLQTPDELVFQGFLTNPVDGNTYLAKMNQGWRGDWQSTLPYTAEPGEGAYLFVFYLFLGHLARWTGLSLIVTFHLARWLSSLFLLWALNNFYRSIGFQDETHAFAMLLSAFGAGMGWLVMVTGYFTADFWVGEAYPFLSAYTNPHFPLGLGLMLCLLKEDSQDLPTGQRKTTFTWLSKALAIMLLALVSPFGVVIVMLVRGVRLIWNMLCSQRVVPSIDEKSFIRNQKVRHELLVILLILVLGMPILVYDLLVAHLHPVLSSWNDLNLTPSPPLWDVLFSFSPALILAVPAAWRRVRSTSCKPDTLVVWLLIGLVLMYFPWSLQRRFMMGLFVPIAGLAVLSLQALAERVRFSQSSLFVFLFLLSFPTPVIILLGGMHGVQTQDPILFLSAGEAECLTWIEANTQPDALILASPEMGLFIPARTGRRVLYGHPFETAHAEQELETLQRLIQQSGEFDQPAVASQYLQQRGVSYLFWGAREAEMGGFPDWSGMTKVCEVGEVSLYQLPRDE